MSGPKPIPSPLPHHIRVAPNGRARREELMTLLLETTSYDREPTPEEAMRETEARSDEDD